MTRQLVLPALLMAAGSLGVLAPVSLTSARGLAAAGAECATCCAQPNATCVICGTEKCVGYDGYYEGKIGPLGCGVQES
jgi:hypothetical protein